MFSRPNDSLIRTIQDRISPSWKGSIENEPQRLAVHVSPLVDIQTFELILLTASAVDSFR